MKTMGYVSLFAGAALLAGCVGQDVDRLNATDISGGTPFTQQLAVEYRDLANFEANEMLDWTDAEYFARKGLASAAGEVVEPSVLADWNLPVDSVDELTTARGMLMDALATGARETFPIEAAIAQAKFDCWVEQQEENIQPDHIAACRDEFYAALALMVDQPGVAGEVFFVFFDFDQSVITAQGQEVINQVIDFYGPDLTIAVAGHTDTSGSAAYNLGLSARRAEAVRQALVAGGVPADAIMTDSFGESDPLVPTPDGVREPSNRRAEIRFVDTMM